MLLPLTPRPLSRPPDGPLHLSSILSPVYTSLKGRKIPPYCQGASTWQMRFQKVVGMGGREKERVNNIVEDGSQQLYTLYLEKGLSMAWALLSRPGWLAS